MRASPQVLDVFQQSAYVNTLFVATFTYGRGIAGRQVPGQPLPDHGKQEYDTDTFKGGSYTRVQPEYYQDTAIQQFRAPDFGDYDVLEAVLPEARKRGMKTICWFEDVWNAVCPNIAQAQEKHFDGSNATTLCFNNPNYRNWLLGDGGGLCALVRDRRHHVGVGAAGRVRQRAGRESRRQGGASRAPPASASSARARRRARGIDPARARAGFQALGGFVQAARQGKRPVDGYYVTLWRLILRHPELLAWEMLWTDSLRETYAAMHSKVKSIKPAVGVGWHIWHNNSFNPIYRAEQDLSGADAVLRLSEDGDVSQLRRRAHGRATSAASAAPCMATCRSRSCSTSTIACWITQQEKPLAEIPKSGLSADYVFREAKRAREALNGTKTQLWPGIDIDIPTGRAQQQVDAGGHAGRGRGGAARGRRWGAAFAQVLRDEAGQSARRGRRDQRGGPGMSATRRTFLQSRFHGGAVRASPLRRKQPQPWYLRTYRWGQTNITEKDPAQYDIAWWREYWKRTEVQGVIINAGGIVAYYPSKFPLQHRAQFLNGRDLYGELAKAAHDDGLAVMARMDSNRTAEDFYQAHPDWFARMADGKPYRAADKYITCINSPYYDEYLPAVLREIIERSHPEGITDNSWAGHGPEQHLLLRELPA